MKTFWFSSVVKISDNTGFQNKKKWSETLYSTLMLSDNKMRMVKLARRCLFVSLWKRELVIFMFFFFIVVKNRRFNLSRLVETNRPEPRPAVEISFKTDSCWQAWREPVRPPAPPPTATSPPELRGTLLETSGFKPVSNEDSICFFLSDAVWHQIQINIEWGSGGPWGGRWGGAELQLWLVMFKYVEKWFHGQKSCRELPRRSEEKLWVSTEMWKWFRLRTRRPRFNSLEGRLSKEFLETV